MRGTLTLKQVKVLQPFVSGHLVHDFGAGDLTLAKELVRLGAKQVLAIDKAPLPDPGTSRILCSEGYFDRIAELASDVAFLSWPSNYDSGVLRLVQPAKTVVYLGKNTDGLACGYGALWEHLTRRKVLAHAPSLKNTLIIYGELGPKRKLLGEELAALELDRVYRYTEALGMGRIDWQPLKPHRKRCQP